MVVKNENASNFYLYNKVLQGLKMSTTGTIGIEKQNFLFSFVNLVLNNLFKNDEPVFGAKKISKEELKKHIKNEIPNITTKNYEIIIKYPENDDGAKGIIRNIASYCYFHYKKSR